MTDKNEVKEMRESPRGKSMLSDFFSCQRLWAWRRLRGLRPLKQADYFITGGIVHEAQEVFYAGLWRTADEAKDAAYQRAEELIDQIDEVDRDRLGKTIKAFLDVWYKELGEKDLENLTIVAVEEQKEIALYNGFKMTVRLDRAFYDRNTKEIFIADTKTTGWSLEGTITNYMRADQPKLYILALQDEPWYNQLAGWRTDCLYVKGKVSRAMRSAIVMPTEEELEDIKRTYTSLTDDIAFKVADVETGTPIGVAFYKNSSNCVNRYGHVCPHYEHCHKIDDLSYHPEGFGIDPWLEERVIQDAFKGIGAD